MYSIIFDNKWPDFFDKLENQLKERILKKIQKILEFPQKRHLKKGLDYFVDQIGQYRIVYRIFEERNAVKFYFVGKHKDYEKWFKQFF